MVLYLVELQTMADAPQLPREREESNRMAFISNALAIVGFIILFVIIVWGLFHIVNLSGTSITSLFSSKPKVTVSVPKTAVSGEPVSISWKYSGKDAGTYSFLYKCDQNFYFGAEASRALARIPCGSAIIVGSSTSATVVPVLSGRTSLDVPVTIIFAPQTGERVQGEATIVITAPTSTTPSTPVVTPKPAKPTTSYPKTSVRKPLNLVAHAASGPADLSVRMILVGVIDPYSGALLPRAPRSPSEIVGVEFDIANIGGSSTGSWYFTANLPTGGGAAYLYTSPLQRSLAPGEHIVNVIRFAPNMRPSTISVIADPANRVYEANENNNIVSQSM